MYLFRSSDTVPNNSLDRCSPGLPKESRICTKWLVEPWTRCQLSIICALDLYQEYRRRFSVSIETVWETIHTTSCCRGVCRLAPYITSFNQKYYKINDNYRGSFLLRRKNPWMIGAFGIQISGFPRPNCIIVQCEHPLKVRRGLPWIQPRLLCTVLREGATLWMAVCPLFH